MAKPGKVGELVADVIGRTVAESKRLAQTYVRVLFDPRRGIPDAVAGSSWPFPLLLIVGDSAVCAALLRVGWPTLAGAIALGDAFAARRPNVPLIFLAGVVFCATLAIAAWSGLKVFAGKRADLLTLLNCVAVAVVPFSALTIAAWIALYLSPGLGLAVFAFGALVAVGFFAEALRSHYDLTIGCGLYAVPLMVVVALLVTGLLLLIVGGRSPAP